MLKIPNDETTISSSEEAFPSNLAPRLTVRRVLRFTLTTWSGKRAGNLLREKYFAALSPQAFLLETYHVLLGFNNWALSTQEKGKDPCLRGI